MSFEMEAIWATMKGPYYERTLRQLQQGICEADSLDAALAAALDRVAPAAHAETGTVWFYDRFGDGLIRPKAVYGGGTLGDITLAPGEGVAGQVIAEDRATIVQNCQTDPRWAGKVDAATGFCTRSMVCVPLSWRERAFGCIQIINKTDDTEFDDTDLTFVQNLAAYAVQLFQQQRLLDEYEESAAAIPVVPAGGAEPTFSTLLSVEDFSEVTEGLRHASAFTRLSGTEQKHVLRHMREIWMILRKNSPPPQKPPSRLFGR